MEYFSPPPHWPSADVHGPREVRREVGEQSRDLGIAGLAEHLLHSRFVHQHVMKRIGIQQRLRGLARHGGGSHK
jgi:hypothetical protein